MEIVNNGQNKIDYWIQTYTGQKFSFTNPTPEMVNIVDIAHALSYSTRFNGHCNRMYSIAQHSLTVAAAMRKDGHPKELALVGLMHDAHEAYVGDISSPFKDHMVQLGFDFRRVETPIKEAISKRFSVNIVNTPKEVVKYDSAVLRTEVLSLFDKDVDNWTQKIEFRLKTRIKDVLAPNVCYDLFIKTFKDLGGKI